MFFQRHAKSVLAGDGGPRRVRFKVMTNVMRQSGEKWEHEPAEKKTTINILGRIEHFAGNGRILDRIDTCRIYVAPLRYLRS